MVGAGGDATATGVKRLRPVCEAADATTMPGLNATEGDAMSRNELDERIETYYVRVRGVVQGVGFRHARGAC